MLHFALGLAAVWFCVHAAIYVVTMCGLDPVVNRHMQDGLKRFYGYQALGFLITAVITCARRPSAVVRVLAAYLAISTVVLLALSRDVAMIARLAVLLLWIACAAQGMRLAIAKAVGQQYATWGIAIAAIYAAFVPVGFFLGAVHAIVAPVVTVLAVVVALPGAAVGVRALLRWFARDRSAPVNVDGRDEEPYRRSIIVCFLIEAMWVVLAIGIVGACTPEVASDSTRVHVPFMQQVVADHGLSHQYPCWHRLQPMAVQTYGAVILAVGGLAAAKWFSWFSLIALALLVVDEIRFRGGSRELAIFGAAAVLACPMLADLSKTLYVDHVLAMLCTAAFIVLFRALGTGQEGVERAIEAGHIAATPSSQAAYGGLRGILFSAAIMASTVQVKYTGLIFAVVWGLFLAGELLRRRGWRVAVQWSITAGAFFTLMACPWYIYVYLGTGNPFYPYLNAVFRSPYWPEGFTMQQVFDLVFKMPSGIGAAAFPWLATYRSTAFVEGLDGLLGFWALALFPCWGLARLCRGTKRYPYGDMAFVAVLMIVGVLAYTPYERYWLPAYPLLVVSCVLAAGTLLDSMPWRPVGHWGATATGAVLGALLFLPAPLLLFNLHWDAYAKTVSTDEYLSRHFPGYQAVCQLNQILAPGDGVLYTGCNGVYLVQANAYEYQSWWNYIHRIHDQKSFEQFCRRNGIRYWLVNRASSGANCAQQYPYVVNECWKDARLVVASGMTSVYDLSPVPPKRWEVVSKRDLPAKIDASGTPWQPTARLEHWANLNSAPAQVDNGSLCLKDDAWIAHRIDPVAPNGLCRVSFHISSDMVTDPLFELSWVDEKGNVLSRVNGAAQGVSGYQARLFTVTPPKAKHGWIYLRELQHKPLRLDRVSVSLWKPSATPAETQRDKTTAAKPTGVR